MEAMNPPECIGIILDGNRRWAKRYGLPSLAGHRQGYEKVIECARLCRDRGIKHLVVYAFSTENWKRTEEEVGYLMDLLAEAVRDLPERFAQERIRIRFIGQIDRLPPSIQDAIAENDKRTEQFDLTTWVCLSYGSRAEITEAAAKTARAGVEISEESLRAHMWSADMPDPDLIIRTGGEMRLSNFLLWQAAYSELFFVEPFWPDFSEADLDRVLEEFSHRSRRHGK